METTLNGSVNAPSFGSMIPICTSASEAINYLVSGLGDELFTARIQEKILVTEKGLATLIELEFTNKEKRQVIYLGED